MSEENPTEETNSPENSSEENSVDIQKLQGERDTYLDGWRRAKADLANYKKEEFTRLEEVAKFSAEELIKDSINVLDSFSLALSTLPSGDPAEKGIYLIKSQLEDILKKRGLSKIEVSVGDTFNPEFHEAVSLVEDSEKEEDTIAEELEPGYTLHSKVIRASKVKVFKKSK